jgi:hypothetical protein
MSWESGRTRTLPSTDTDAGEVVTESILTWWTGLALIAFCRVARKIWACSGWYGDMSVAQNEFGIGTPRFGRLWRNRRYA